MSMMENKCCVCGIPSFARLFLCKIFGANEYCSYYWSREGIDCRNKKRKGKKL